MGKPQTINGLMRHLRNDCDINIAGIMQKKQLVCYGYYHGYKGYRFFYKPQNRIRIRISTNLSRLLSMIML